MGWIKAPHKQWVQQSKSVWLALLSAEHLQGAGRHLSTPKANRGGQLTPGTPLGSHFADIRGMGFSASSLSLWWFTSFMSWRQHVGEYNTGVD